MDPGEAGVCIRDKISFNGHGDFIVTKDTILSLTVTKGTVSFRK
jgi:hypothetical protein